MSSQRLLFWVYSAFIISINKCNGSFNTAKDPFCGICVPNEIEDMKIIVFNMIKEINESEALAKHIPYESRCEFDGRKCSSKQKLNNDKCQWECKKTIKYRECEEDHVWNPSTCACEFDKDCEIDEYLKECEWVKSLIDDLVPIYDEIDDTPKSVVINPSNGINYCLIAVSLLAIACLLLLVIMIVKYCESKK